MGRQLGVPSLGLRAETRYGADELRYQWREFGKTRIGRAIAAAMIVAGLAITGFGRDVTSWLLDWLVVVTFLAPGWLMAGPVLSIVLPKREPADGSARQRR